jgi:hypothetical protein
MGLPPAAQPAILALMIVFGLYLAYEASRWYGGNRAALTPGQFRRRMWGGLLLELDLLMWLLAEPLMRGRPVSERLLYLLAATLLVFIPMFLAVREAAFIARQYAQWRRELVRNLGQRDGDNG